MPGVVGTSEHYLPERFDENVRPLFPPDASDETSAPGIIGDAEDPTCFVTVEKGDGICPCVRDPMHSWGGDTPFNEAVTHRPRHCHCGVGFPERTTLEVLVEPVLPVAADESVRGRNCRDAKAARHGTVQHVSPVTMRVHYVGSERTADLAHDAALAVVGPPTGMDRMCRNATGTKRDEHGMIRNTRVENRSD